MTRALDPASAERLLADARWLRSLARSLAGESGADDLVSETWLSAVRRPPRFWENLRPWLRTVARNLWLRERQREAQRREREARAARSDSQPSTADLVARATLRRSVVEAVLDLPEPYRSTILLRFFEELPPREVARRLGVPVATVRTRISRALLRLRQRLDREQGGSAAWIAMLVPAKSLLGAFGLTGAIVMATKTKVAGVAVAVLLGALGWWQWSRLSARAEASAPNEAPTAQAGAPESRPASPPAAAAIAASRAIRPQRYSEPGEKGFAITGIVVDDRNDQPVEGVAAKIMAWTPKPESVATDATTDREGKFAVPVHQKNQMRGVTFYSPEHAPLVLDHLENDVRGAHGDVLDVGTIRLLRGARVSGRVVSAETKEPVPDAQLFVSPRGYPVTQPLLAEARPVGRSGADGTFTLTERVPPPPPRWDREAILTAVTPDGIGWTFLAIVKDRETLDGIEVAIARGATMRVTVVDEADKPVEGARVAAAPRFAPLGPPQSFGADYAGGWLQDPAIREHFAQETRSDGTVAFRGLPIGRPDERFSQYYSSPTGYSISVLHEDFVRSDPLSIEVDPAAEVAARVKLGRKTRCTVRGRVTSESGVPVEGARVGPTRTLEFVTTDRDGNYRLEGRDTAHGWGGLDFKADGYAKVWRRVELRKGGEDVVVDVVLPKSAPIAGRVIDQDGRPVSGAYVDLLDGRTDPERRQLRPDGGGDLDSAGRFVFSDATAGAWKLRVYGEPHDEWVAPRDRIVQGGDQNVEVVLRVRPKGRAGLDAEIVDAGTAAPLDPAEARLMMTPTAVFSGDSVATAGTQLSSGRVKADKLRPGKWSLFVRLADGRRVTREFVVKPDDISVRLRVEIGKPGSVVVRIDRSRIPAGDRPSTVAVFTVPGDAVQWMTKPGQVAPRCTRGYGQADASNDWTLLFEDVTPNVPIRFWTTIDGVKPCHAEIVVTVGFGEQKDVVLKLGTSAHVTFRKPERAPSGGLKVFVRRADGAWDEVMAESYFWEEGKPWETKREIIPGRVSWRAELYSLDVDPTERVALATVEGEVDVAAGESRDVPIVFP
jgi:RNA polymerase sigma factor (sigma-70 family)